MQLLPGQEFFGARCTTLETTSTLNEDEAAIERSSRNAISWERCIAIDQSK